jgi:hypothetical protein
MTWRTARKTLHRAAEPWHAEPVDQPLSDLGSAPDGILGAVPGFFVVVLVLVALVGVAVVLGGLRMTLRARRRSRDAERLRAEGRRTTGVVVDNQFRSGPERRMTFAPVVRFAAGDREVVVVGDQRWNRSFVTGRPAEVLYDPAAPDRAHVRAEGGSVLGEGPTGVFVVVVGVVFLVLVAVTSGLVRSVF